MLSKVKNDLLHSVSLLFDAEFSDQVATTSAF